MTIPLAIYIVIFSFFAILFFWPLHSAGKKNIPNPLRHAFKWFCINLILVVSIVIFVILLFTFMYYSTSKYCDTNLDDYERCYDHLRYRR